MRQISLVAKDGSVLSVQIREFADSPRFILCDGLLYRRKDFSVYVYLERPLPAYRLYRMPAAPHLPIAA